MNHKVLASCTSTHYSHDIDNVSERSIQKLRRSCVHKIWRYVRMYGPTKKMTTIYSHLRRHIKRAITPKIYSRKLRLQCTAFLRYEVHLSLKFQVSSLNSIGLNALDKKNITKGSNSKIMKRRILVILHCTAPIRGLFICEVSSQQLE